MINYYGWIGLGLLLTAYVFLYFKRDKWFFILNITANLSYIAYALINMDMPILLVNIFILIVCLKRVL